MKRILCALICLAFVLAAGNVAPALACGGGGGMDHGSMDHGSMHGNTGSSYGHMGQGQMGYGYGGQGRSAYASPAPRGTWSTAPGVPQGGSAPAAPNPGTAHDHQH